MVANEGENGPVDVSVKGKALSGRVDQGIGWLKVGLWTKADSVIAFDDLTVAAP